jgi:hypothetical protein
MKLQSVNFEQAKLLKEKGFDWDDGNWYHGEMINYETTISKQAKLLKEKGFDWDGGNWYHGEMEHFLAPTQAFVCKWFRDVHGIIITTVWVGISNVKEQPQYLTYDVHIKVQPDGAKIVNPRIGLYKSIEIAESAGIDYALKNLI